MDDAAFASVNSFGGIDYAPHNRGVTPVFFVEPVQDFAASEREGRAVYVQKERVRVHVAGDPLSAATHPVDAGVIARYREHYEKWKRGKSEDHIVGTPLSKWPMATPVMIKELETLNVYSVEDLVAVSDGNVSNFTDGRAIREKAIAWLASSKDGAAAMRFAAENQRLRDEMAELRKLVVKSDGNSDLVAPRVAQPKMAKKAKRKSSWTPERRAAASEAMKARHAMPSSPVCGDDLTAPRTT